jgi:signal transduction histidine kinase
LITRRPRTVLGVAVGLLVVLLALFTAALLRANGNDREDAERRFQDRARVSASLTEAIFSSTSQQAATQNRRRYGGATIDKGVLDRAAKQGRLSYLVVLDDQGVPIAFSTNTPPEALERIAGKPDDVREALAGKPFFLSDFLDDVGGGGVMEYATPFEAQDGRRRVAVSGFGAQLIALFLGNYLGKIPDGDRASSYVVDSQNRVVGSPVAGQAPGTEVRLPGLVAALEDGKRFGTFDSDGTQRAYTSSSVGNSTWRVLLSVRASQLYSGISTTVQWLILAALALAGIAAVFLLARTLRAAAQVQHAYDRLESANTELAHSNLELKRSNAELEQFASVASHDLQEPLRKVQTFGDQLERRFGDQIPEEAVDYLRRMRRAANRMSTLIEDLLRFSRVTTHAKPPVPVDLARIAREVTGDLEAPLQETHGSVEIGALPIIEADPVQMRQLLQNLIANGLKFHRPGIPPVVRLEPVAARDRNMVSFSATDNGIGFEQQYEERIFRVFERLHPRDVYQGTGIGLALCRKIVERHGGTITGEGRPGDGATFIVTMPLEQAQPAPTNGSAPADAVTDPEPAHA